MLTGIIAIWIKPLPLPSPPAVGVDRDTINIYSLLGNVTPPFPFSLFIIIISLSVSPSYTFTLLLYTPNTSPEGKSTM